MLKSNRFKHGSQGFTIIESLIAIILLLIMMTGGMAFYTMAAKHAGESAHQKIALKLADSQMEYLRSSSLVAGTTSAPVPIGALQAQGTMTTTIVDASAYNQVFVNVSWDEPGITAKRGVVLQTYMAK